MIALFRECGEEHSDSGWRIFSSQRALIEALEKAGHTTTGSRSTGQEVAKALERDFCADGDGVQTKRKAEALVLMFKGKGRHGGTRYVLRAP